MKVESKTSAELIFREIFVEDVYDIRKFPNGFFNTMIDIGSYVGHFSMLARVLQPQAKIIAFEPCKKNYCKLKENVANLNIECSTKALGRGGYLFEQKDEPKRRKKLKAHSIAFANKIDRPSLFKKMFLKPIKSYPLYELVDFNNIEGNYCLKIDCEGGEASLIDDLKAEEIIRKAAHIGMEIHCANEDNAKGERFKIYGLPSLEIYKNWLQKFENTHDIKWTEDDTLPTRGTVVMTKKDIL